MQDRQGDDSDGARPGPEAGSAFNDILQAAIVSMPAVVAGEGFFSRRPFRKIDCLLIL